MENLIGVSTSIDVDENDKVPQHTHHAIMNPDMNQIFLSITQVGGFHSHTVVRGSVRSEVTFGHYHDIEAK